MAAICANTSDRKSYMNEIDGFSVLLTSTDGAPKEKEDLELQRKRIFSFFIL